MRIFMSISFLIIFHVITEISECENTDDWDDINKLFPSFQDTQPKLNDTSDVVYKNITVDLEKLDVKKFKNKLENDLKDKIKEEDKTFYKSGRRQVLHYTWDRGKWTYVYASTHLIKQKATDLMLQYIYMARQKLKSLESDAFFSKTDTGYRIGYLFRRMNFFMRALRNVYSRMVKDKNELKNVTTHILWHQKAVKIHTDFLFVYWVSIKLDGKYRDNLKDYPTLPKSQLQTGGLTDDDELFQRPRIKGPVLPTKPPKPAYID